MGEGYIEIANVLRRVFMVYYSDSCQVHTIFKVILCNFICSN